MKTAINRSCKMLTFPILGITFLPHESKMVSDELASILKEDVMIIITTKENKHDDILEKRKIQKSKKEEINE